MFLHIRSLVFILYLNKHCNQAMITTQGSAMPWTPLELTMMVSKLC